MSVTDLIAEMPSADAAIGARIHQLMFLRGVTQVKLAARLGVAQTTVSKKVRGSVGWSTDDLLVVSDTLKTSIAYLFGESEDPRPIDPHTQKGPDRGGSGPSLPDLDSNQEPPH
jgi:transcriptional regulator with XRE-family HTH domain